MYIILEPCCYQINHCCIHELKGAYSSSNRSLLHLTSIHIHPKTDPSFIQLAYASYYRSLLHLASMHICILQQILAASMQGAYSSYNRYLLHPASICILQQILATSSEHMHPTADQNLSITNKNSSLNGPDGKW